jgi:hypothetical protein
VDLAAWREAGRIRVLRNGRELSFRPSEAAKAGARDTAGRRWDLDGDPEALDLSVSDDGISPGEYPEALGRLWGGVCSRRAGDVVLSATPGNTFGEVSGGFHKASDHGSLHASDSNVFALASGMPVPRGITDVAPILLSHFAGSGARRLGF